MESMIQNLFIIVIIMKIEMNHFQNQYMKNYIIYMEKMLKLQFQKMKVLKII